MAGKRGKTQPLPQDKTVSTSLASQAPVAGELSREQLEVVLESVSDGVTVQGPTGALLYANDAAARLIGYPSARAVLDVPSDEVRRGIEVLDELGRRLDEADLPGRRALRGEAVSDRVLLFRRSGSADRRWALVSSSPVTDEEGTVRFAVNVFRDVTAMKLAEERLLFLSRAGEMLSSSLDHAVTLERLAELVTPRLADWFAVEMLDERGTLRNVAVGHADPKKQEWARRMRQRYPPDVQTSDGLGRVLSAGVSLLYPEIPPGTIERAARDPEHLRMLLDLGMRSVMIVPLSARDRILGAISFVSSRPELRYGSDDLALAQELARRAGIAIENARLHQAERRSRRKAERAADRTSLLQSMTAMLAEARGAESIARVVVREGLRAVEASGGAMFLVAAEGDALELAEPTGYDDHVLEGYRRIPLDMPMPVAEAARRGQAIYLRSEDEARERYPASVRSSPGSQAWAAVPLEVKGSVIGVLALTFARRRSFGRADRAFLDALAHQAAQALDRVRLYEAEHEARSRAEALSVRLLHLEAISRAGLSHIDLESLLSDLLERIRSIVSADRAVILLREGADLRVRAATGLEEDVAAGVRVPMGKGVAGRIAARAAPLVVENIAALDPVSTYLRERTASLAGVPLLHQGQVIGVLHVSTDRPRRFTSEDVSVLELVAARAALAINQAQVHEHERRISEGLQRSLLPERLPDVAGLDVAARYVPGGRDLEVGGDWYDAVALEDGRVVLMVGDVVGHGLQAASFMGQLRNALRAYALEGHSPSSMLERLDQLIPLVDRDAIATVLCLALDLITGEIVYASAGHPPALLLEPGEEPRFLVEGRTVPLGAVDEPLFPEVKDVAPVGTTLLLYTDGLVESRTLAIDEGMARLVDAAGAGMDDAEKTAGRVLETLLGEDPPEDDVALMVARITGTAIPC
jgi:PAS domain S-box-containing protein